MVKKVNIISTDTLSDNFFPLKKVVFEVEKSNGDKEEQTREVYHSRNGVTVLLYNKDKKTVVLTQQFRIASYLNKNASGLLIESCAGLQDDDTADDAIMREIEEETGYKVDNVKKIFELYSTPGAVTEKLHYFIAEYSEDQKISEGGGLDEEGEEIEVLEMPFKEAYLKIETGELGTQKQ
jgi:nudix-type nucleoside diphosphatase (YffH/AdpP family)